ncbi:MAG TPA: AAA family ATPase, partial [Longimicrobiales bacterium]|nr:AAA family ATPase [Longimicrobiales bacterium]
MNYNLKRKAGGTVVSTDGALVRLSEGVRVEWEADPAWEAFPTPTDAFRDRLGEIRVARTRESAREVVRELESARLADAPEEMLTALARETRGPAAWRDGVWALLRTGRIREAEFELRRVFGSRLPAEGLSLVRRLASEASDLLEVASAGRRVAIPLMGRSEELWRLGDLLVQQARSILVTGVHGVGRSRLLGHAVATLLSEEGDAVLLNAAGHANERDHPFGGLSQLLSDDILRQAHEELGQPDHEVLSRALPLRFESKGPHPLAIIGGPGSYLRVARAIEVLFQQAFGPVDVVLCVDDLDEIDRSTLEVITFLLRDGTARLIGTWCTEDAAADNELLFRIQGLDAQLVRLGDLDLGSAAAFARAAGPDLPANQAEDIARLAGGRPGRIVDLINALGGSGLPRTGGPSLEALLRVRVRELEAPAQRVLLLLSVNRGRLDIGTLAHLLEVGILTASGHARALEEAGLVRIEGGHAVLVPALLRDFVLRELPGAVLQQTHEEIADVLEKIGSEDFAALGHHRLASGNPADAAVWFRKAASKAKDQTAYAEAISFLEKSIAASDEYDPELGGDLGRLYAGMGDFESSIHAYERAREAFGAEGRADKDLGLRLGRLAAELEHGEDKDRLYGEVRAAITSAHALENPELVSRGLDLWLKIADYGHDHRQVQDARASLLRELNRQQFHAHLGLVGARLSYLGDRLLGRRLAQKAYLASKGDDELRGMALSRLIICLFNQSLFDGRRATVLSLEADRLAQEIGDLNTRFGLLANRVVWLMDCARWDAAETAVERSMRFVVGPNTVELQTLTINQAVLHVRR